MNHQDASAFCESKGKRLPTVREALMFRAQQGGMVVENSRAHAFFQGEGKAYCVDRADRDTTTVPWEDLGFPDDFWLSGRIETYDNRMTTRDVRQGDPPVYNIIGDQPDYAFASSSLAVVCVD